MAQRFRILLYRRSATKSPQSRGSITRSGIKVENGKGGTLSPILAYARHDTTNEDSILSGCCPHLS